MSAPVETRVQNVLDFFGQDTDHECWDTRTFSEIKFIRADVKTQSTEFELNIAPFLCNKVEAS